MARDHLTRPDRGPALDRALSGGSGPASQLARRGRPRRGGLRRAGLALLVGHAGRRVALVGVARGGLALVLAHLALGLAGALLLAHRSLLSNGRCAPALPARA